MKIYVIKIIAIMLILIGSTSSCKNDDIDMSKIDFSNIEDLYAQPLSVIQKCVEGKWKVYVQYGGAAGISYLKDTYVEINGDQYILTNPKERYVFNITWEKMYVDWMGSKTWVMQRKDLDEGEGGSCFYSIMNDSLTTGNTYSDNRAVRSILVRIK